ncbi:MAG: hypothetical protein JSV92_00835 [archaeon]|nr:MAG: hypothetical protein JSV92_00835 [archaeon]
MRDVKYLVNAIREAGRRARFEAREIFYHGEIKDVNLEETVITPDIAADEVIEKTLRKKLHEKGFEYVYASEERKKPIILGSDPDLAFLIDPMDQSERTKTGQLDGGVTSCITVLKIDEITENGYKGMPFASLVIELERGTEYIAFEGKARIAGEVKKRFLRFDDELPKRIEGEFIGPNDYKTLKTGQLIMGANYSTKNRNPEEFRNEISFLEKYVNAPLKSVGTNVRFVADGGSYFSANVGTGVYSISMESIPTKPSEAAGDVFAKNMGGQVTDMFGNPLKKVKIECNEKGLKKNYHSLATCNPKLTKEILDTISMTEMQKFYNYGDL